MIRTPSQRQALRRRGFTIIELLMIVTVVGVMMAIVVPRMRVSESTEVQLAAMQLAQDLDLTRTRALSTRSFSRVSFSPGPTASYAGYLDTDGDSTITDTDAERLALQAFGRRPLPDRVTIGRGSAPGIPGDYSSSAVTFSNQRVDFDTRGLPTPMGTSGVIYLQHTVDASRVLALAVSPAGNVRVWTWRDGAWQ